MYADYFKDENVADYFDPSELYYKDIPFYKKFTDKYSDFLELGIGTGRVALELARNNANVTGIDSSNEMLNIARKKIEKENLGERVKLIQGDMRDFFLKGKTFEVAYIAEYTFCSLQTTSDQEHCLSSIYCHLKKDGILIIHLFLPKAQYLGNHKKGGIGGAILEDGGYYTLENGNHLLKTLFVTYDNSTQLQKASIIHEEMDAHSNLVKKFIKPLSVRIVYRYEMELLLKNSGFDLLNVFGDFNENPLTDGSWDMIFVAKKG
ncbi:class I SAM-dependent methyltransferase [Sporolactobacillus sp. KGMB 08714]|uniref:class I SAM-dependent methyltransferase n=1 Tax=Sporolactobacillus sp. KGMB 08714 TaxID=3064704 RepID=UPI002FBD6B96